MAKIPEVTIKMDEEQLARVEAAVAKIPELVKSIEALSAALIRAHLNLLEKEAGECPDGKPA